VRLEDSIKETQKRTKPQPTPGQISTLADEALEQILEQRWQPSIVVRKPPGGMGTVIKNLDDENKSF
jgi:hypothetical protein